MSDGAPPSTTGALMRSGAAELLQAYSNSGDLKDGWDTRQGDLSHGGMEESQTRGATGCRLALRAMPSVRNGSTPPGSSGERWASTPPTRRYRNSMQSVPLQTPPIEAAHRMERTARSPARGLAFSSLPSCFRFSVGVVTITALIGPTRRPPAVFPQHFKPFAWAGLSLTGIAVGLSRFSTGESELRKGAVSR